VGPSLRYNADWNGQQRIVNLHWNILTGKVPLELGAVRAEVRSYRIARGLYFGGTGQFFGAVAVSITEVDPTGTGPAAASLAGQVRHETPVGTDGGVMAVYSNAGAVPGQAEGHGGDASPQCVGNDLPSAVTVLPVVEQVLTGRVESRVGRCLVSGGGRRRVVRKGTSCRKMSLTPLSSSDTRSLASLWKTTQSPRASAAG
jgi:hypothetical protein